MIDSSGVPCVVPAVVPAVVVVALPVPVCPGVVPEFWSSPSAGIFISPGSSVGLLFSVGSCVGSLFSVGSCVELFCVALLYSAALVEPSSFKNKVTPVTVPAKRITIAATNAINFLFLEDCNFPFIFSPPS